MTFLHNSLAELWTKNDGFTWTTSLVTILAGIAWLYFKPPQQNDPQKTSQLNATLTDRPLRTDATGVGNPLQEVRVSRLLIHPIKSCRGISLQEANYSPEGMEFDRIWAIIDAEKHAIITAREVSKMVLITPEIKKDDALPYLGRLVISFPSDVECETTSVPLRPTEEILRSWQMLPEIRIWPTHKPVDGYICESVDGIGPSPTEVLTKYFGKPVYLVYKGPRPRESDPTTRFPDLKVTAKYQDMYPLLVLSEESMPAVEQELRKHVGTQGIDERWRTGNVAIERYRPNIVFSGGGPFAEDDWEEIVIGTEDAPTITLVSRCTRCLLPNVSPETGVRDAAVPFKVTMKFRVGLDPKHKMKPCVGCNAAPAENGVVRVGDRVFVKKMLSNPPT